MVVDCQNVELQLRRGPGAGMTSEEALPETKVEETMSTPSPSTAAPDTPEEPVTPQPKEQSAFRADAPTFVPQAISMSATSQETEESDIGTMRQFEELEALLSADSVQDGQVPSAPEQVSPVKDSKTFRADAPSFIPPSHCVANGTSEASAISLFDQLWKAEAVPDALKELWVPAEVAAPHSGVEATQPATTLRIQESSGFRADAPTFVPQAQREVAANTVDWHQLWASQLGVLENPLLATPPPKGFAARDDLLDTPEKVSFTAPSFVAARARLLAVRAHMGRRPIPQDLKVRASFIDHSGSMDSRFPELECEEPTRCNPVAGAMLLQLVRGEVSAGNSKEGAEQGTELLSLIKANGRSKKDFTAQYTDASVGNGRREQRHPAGVNGSAIASGRPRDGARQNAGFSTPAVSAHLAPSRAEIRKAAAAARELEKSSKVDDGSLEKAAVKEQSTGRSRNAKRAANLVDP